MGLLIAGSTARFIVDGSEHRGLFKGKKENKEKYSEKGRQCYQHSSDATTNAQQQQLHALK